MPDFDDALPDEVESTAKIPHGTADGRRQHVDGHREHEGKSHDNTEPVKETGQDIPAGWIGSEPVAGGPAGCQRMDQTVAQVVFQRTIRHRRHQDPVATRLGAESVAQRAIVGFIRILFAKFRARNNGSIRWEMQLAFIFDHQCSVMNQQLGRQRKHIQEDQKNKRPPTPLDRAEPAQTLLREWTGAEHRWVS